MLKKAQGCKEVLSIGGGSTIDVGKYVASHLRVPHTAIPTTAGTGSEVTKYAVFIKDGRKMSLEDDRLIPDSYVLDPERLTTLPPEQTVASGLDALSQAIESYWSPNSTIKSRWYSKKAIALIMNNLYDSYRNPYNEALRASMLKAANYSGRAINITKTGVCHAISYPLTTHYGIPHGVACAITLPHMILYNDFRLVPAQKVERLIESLGISIFTLKQQIDKELVIKEAFESSRIRNNPFPISKDDLRVIL